MYKNNAREKHEKHEERFQKIVSMHFGLRSATKTTIHMYMCLCAIESVLRSEGKIEI